MVSLPRRLLILVAFSLAAGVVLAGIMTPVVAGIGLAAQHGISSWNRLPSALNIRPLPMASKIYTADGHLLATFYYQDRIPVSLDEIPTVMQQSIISIEDYQFYSERGLDLKGLVRAALKDASGGARQGGSTLTQQYVKNILLQEAQTPAARQAAIADTLHRKIQEARYAIALAQRMTKAQILEGYLNIAYFGDGAYGVGAAAEHYFGEPVQRLTLPQSALLAGIVEDPTLYDPVLHPQHARARRDVVLARMAQLKVISQSAAAAAEAAPIKLHVTVARNGCVGTAAPYFCDYVVQDVLRNPVFGATPGQRAQLLEGGGLTIHTTLSSKDQQAAQQAVDNLAPWNGAVGSAEVMVQPNTGAIRAMVVNAPYGPAHGENSVNWAADASHGTSLGFQAGSSFKIFTLATALEQGIPLTTTYYAPPVINYPPGLTGLTDCAGHSLVWNSKITNATPNEGGTFNVLTATWASVNTFFAKLEQKTGLCGPATMAANLGVRQASGRPLRQVPSMVLGSNTVSPVDMAGAYAGFANNGLFCPPYAISEVIGQTGKALPLAHPACRQVVPPNVAATVTNVLTGVLTQPSGTAYGSSLPGRPAAGKTGTIDAFHQAWFDGYTPQLAAAVWVGFPHNPNLSMRNITIGGRFYPVVYGATLPAPIWQQSMQNALSGQPVEQFPAPDPQFYQGGAGVTVPNLDGKSVQTALSALNGLGLSASVGAGEVASSEPQGTVAGTSPPAGSAVSPGSSVTLLISNGQPPTTAASPSPQPSNSPAPQPGPGQPGPPQPSSSPGGPGRGGGGPPGQGGG